jgi:signal transduction histidine kinase
LIQKIIELIEEPLLKIEEIIKNVEFQSKMLTNLINDLLDLSKIDSLNFNFNNEFFDIIEIVKMA